MTEPISASLTLEALNELWYAFKLRTFRSLVAAVKSSGLERSEIASRIKMDPGQLSRTLSGERNVTIRTLFNIARAINHRLEIKVVNLSNLQKPKDNSLYPPKITSLGNVIEVDFTGPFKTSTADFQQSSESRTRAVSAS